MAEEVFVCRVCGLPILDGQPFHGARWDYTDRTGEHWDCAEQTKSEYRKSLERIPELIKKMDENFDQLRGALRRVGRGDDDE